MENKNIEKVSFRIKELRLSRNYTMEKLAELVGVSKSTIAKWENGYVENMRQDKVKKLAEIFNVKPTYIMGYDESMDYVIKSKDGSDIVIEKSDTSEHVRQFVERYSQLSESDRSLIDGMLKSLSSKQ